MTSRPSWNGEQGVGGDGTEGQPHFLCILQFSNEEKYFLRRIRKEGRIRKDKEG